MAAVGAVMLLILSQPMRWLHRRTRGRRRIVYLGTGQIAQVFPRNGVNLFLERGLLTNASGIYR